MARIEWNTAYWPLFVTVMPAQFGVADVEALIVEVDRLYERRERFATLVETSPLATMPGAAERKRLADWQNDTIDRIRTYNVFTATVVHSALIRGALTAMHWIFRPPNEQVAVASFQDGFIRCVTKLREDGVRLPAALEEAAETPPRSVNELLTRDVRQRTAR